MGTIIAQGHDLATPATTSVMSSLLAGLQSCSLEEASPAAAPPPPLQQAASAISALGELPDEVLLVVASHLGVAALGALAQVDRRLRAIAEDDALWREMFGARFCFRPKNAPSSWKLAYRDYEATPRWHPTEKHPQLIATDDGLTVTMPSALDLGDNSAEGTDNRTIRATVEYKPGSGLHYFEVESRCPNEVRYHPYVGLCSTNEAVPVNKMLMWLSDLCYAYGGNGTLYSSPSLEGNHKHLGKYEYGDKIGVMVDYREEGHGWLTFFLNSKAVSSRMRITGTWFPCVGVFHPRHALQIVVRPQVPKPPCEEEEEEQELATA